MRINVGKWSLGLRLGRDRACGVRAGFIACLAWLVMSVVPGAAAMARDDGRVFPVSRVEIRYAGSAGGDVPADALLDVPVTFARLPGGALASPQEGTAEYSVTMREIGSSGVQQVHASGIRSMLLAVRDEMVRRTGFGVYVVPDPEQIILRGNGEDYRQGATDLRILLYTSRRMAGNVAETAPVPKAPETPLADVAPSKMTTRPSAVKTTRTQPTPAPVERTVEMKAEPVTSPAVETVAPVETGTTAEPVDAPAAASPTPPAARDAVAPADVPLSEQKADEKIDGAAFRMTGFTYTYARPHPDLPAADALNEITVRLLRVGDGFIAREGEGSPVRLGDLGTDGALNLYQSGIIACERAIVNWFGTQSIVGVYVVPDVEQIETLDLDVWDDYREGVTTFPLVIYAAQVSRVKTIASGDRIASEDRLNSNKHARIARHSPLVPWSGEGPRHDLLRLEPLNNYAYRLSRHPGRRVDVAVANAMDPEDPNTQGNAEVQYLIQEIKPWTAYFQLSNTGTVETNEWRERFGFVHNQLFGFDDIFNLDYITSDLRDSHAIISSYDVPLTVDDTVRLRLSGGWSKYKATDVGLQNEQFDGESYYFGPELSVNIFQRDDFFVDAYGGFQYQDIEVTNRALTDGKGEEEVFVAQVGLRAERRRAEYSFGADVGLEFSINDLTGADKNQLERLGRLDPDEDWTVLKWSSDLSFYLDGIGSWNPRPSRLVHEIAMRFGGQYSFNNRLIPNYEAVGGGLYTVRGYPESVSAGDTGVFGSVEYRLHIPRALPADADPPTVFGEPFRISPDGQGGRPDWDLVLKVFFDAGRIINAQRLGFEKNETLMSTGIGGELVLANNVSFRTDWGIVLDETGADTPDAVTVGSQRWHFVLTVLY